MNSVFIHSHVHVLKRHDGAHLGFQHQNRPYVIAFARPSLALKIAKHTNKPANIALHQHVTVNLLADMTQIQRAYWEALTAIAGDDGTIRTPAPNELQVNFAGLLTFEKEVLPVTEMCSLSEVAVDDVLEYPLTRNLGIAIVRGITADAPGTCEAEAVVIEPNTRPSDWRGTFRI